MVRQRDEDMLEPILPKHPPTEREVVVDEGLPAATAHPSSRPSWDRLVLVGCAVVATLALVVVALRTNSIAEHERVQTCQIRLYAVERSAYDSGREAQQRFGRTLAECIGLDPEADEDSD